MSSRYGPIYLVIEGGMNLSEGLIHPESEEGKHQPVSLFAALVCKLVLVNPCAGGGGRMEEAGKR